MFKFNVYPTNPELDRVTTRTVKNKISYLRCHFEKIENIFKIESEELLQEVNLENKRTKSHEDDSQYDYRPSDSLRDIEFIYLRMHRYSAILASYSYLESSMLKICTDLEKRRNIAISVSDLQGDGIFRCKKYLNKMAGIDFEEINHQWSDLATLNKLRNCIVHADGDAERVRGSDNFIAQIESSADLFFVEERLLMISSNFVYSSLNNIESVLVYLASRST